jgi:glycine betaine/proline transport system ATP-binding protein
VQVGTPEEILRNPVDDYVRSFVRGVDASAVFKAGDIARKSQVVVSEQPGKGSRAALKMLEDQDRNYAYVVSTTHQYLGVVSADSLRAALDGHVGPLGLRHAFLPDVQPIATDEPVNGLYGQVAQCPYPVPVTAPDGKFKGAISKTTLLKFLDRDTPSVPPQ